MGQPKEWLPIDGQAMLVRVVQRVAAAAGPVVVAARPGQSLPELPPGVLIVGDETPDHGPLAGLIAGLAALTGRCEAAFVTGCDHPWLAPAFIHALHGRLGDHDAVALMADGRPMPLPAVYRLSVVPAARELLSQGQLRLGGLLAACRANLLRPEDLPPDVDVRASLANVNRPADLDVR
jgi:molybdopterin-guanine dinucleotide biosynthesis protein A